jgi:antitoxin (DNA-binding transcriptional repressor) of toxin-antitoxin stability system
MMYHMKTMSVRDLRYRFPQVEAQLREGEEIAITKRKRVIARLVPERPAESKQPDFMAMLKKIYGKKKQKVSGAELVAMQRGDR